MLTKEQVDYFWEHGFLRIERVFEPEHLLSMREDLNWMIERWANRFKGWVGPWRRVYMDEETEKKSQLVAMHDLHFYAQSWMRAVTHARLCEAMGELLGGAAELHHSTMHVKPPETGHPFPMHQDWAFYKHVDNRYVDVLVHLDDTCHDNGEIRFLDGSHKLGSLKHITEADGVGCTPHLPTDKFKLADTVEVPAKAGDVVCFNINTIHGSHINVTKEMRRLVRVGYRHPENKQFEGQSMDRPGLMVYGKRERREGEELFSTAGPAKAITMEQGVVRAG